jgi:hypothetical protein
VSDLPPEIPKVTIRIVTFASLWARGDAGGEQLFFLWGGGCGQVDRNAWAKEHGYCTHLFLMHPLTVTPKNDIIAGCWVDPKQRVACPLCDTAGPSEPEDRISWLDHPPSVNN